MKTVATEQIVDAIRATANAYHLGQSSFAAFDAQQKANWAMVEGRPRARKAVLESLRARSKKST